MNREDLSKMSKDQLINMLMGKQIASVQRTGPVKQTASAKRAGPVFKPKSLTQLAAEKLEQSMKRPAVLPKQSTRLPTLKTLAANAMVKDKIKYFEELSDKQAPTIRLHKKPVSLQNMRDEELGRARVSKYTQHPSFQNLFHNRLQQMPSKRERAQITINAVIEHTIGNRTEFADKTYGPFKMEVPKLSKPDMYKFLTYTLLQNNFTVLSTETIAEIGATITTYNELFFKDHIAGALKLNTFFLDKQFQIKRRGDNTCMVDFVWHNCKDKKGFQKYTYQKLYDEMEVYGSASFPMMSTQELIDWAKACHPNVSIHAYDSTWRKFMKHIASSKPPICLVFYVKDHHLYPIQDDRLKHIATKANQGGADNLWRYMSELKWSNKSSNYIMYQDLINDEIVAKKDKPTLSTIENHVIVLPLDTKIEPIIEEYMIRTNYFVEFLHYDNNDRLDGFMDHKNNMYVLNNEYENRKSICERLYKIYKSYDFIWCNQSYTSLASSLFKHMRGYWPESQYDTKTREVLDDFYPRALQWCSTDPAPDNLVSLDISKCYPSILIDNESPIPLYTIHDIIKPFDGVLRIGEYYIDEYVIDKQIGKGIKIVAGFYSELLVRALITKFKMPISNVKCCIQARKTLAPDTFKNYMLAIFSMFPESQAKLLANSYIGELGRKYSRKDHGFTCSLLDTAQCIWPSALAENHDVVIDSYQNPNTKQELYLIRERQIERIFSDNTSINRFVISQSILKCLNMLHDNASHDNDGNGISQVYAINTDGVFMTSPKNQYPNKKDVKFTTDSIGQIFQTDSPAVYFEKYYRENFDPDNYPDYVGDGAIYYGGAGCGKTYRFCQKVLAADDSIILKSVLCDVYNNYELAKKCYTFDLFFCDHHGRDITALEGKTIFVDEYSMTPNKWMTKLYHAFTKYKLTIYMVGDTNQCDPVEPTDMFYDYFKSVPITEMCPQRVKMKYIEDNFPLRPTNNGSINRVS